jgi:hypothetical protein
MGNGSDVEICKRVKAEIDGENFYITVGADFVHATVPYENRPDNAKLRRIVDSICHSITKAQGGEDESC